MNEKEYKSLLKEGIIRSVKETGSAEISEPTMALLFPAETFGDKIVELAFELVGRQFSQPRDWLSDNNLRIMMLPNKVYRIVANNIKHQFDFNQPDS